MSKIRAYMTGERVTPESSEHGDADARGWVDPSWSRHVFHESRNDVRPLMDEWVPHDSLPDVLRPDEPLSDIATAVLTEYLGSYRDNGDGTFYGTSEDVDYETGDVYTYAVHFYIKDGNGERSCHPDELREDS